MKLLSSDCGPSRSAFATVAVNNGALAIEYASWHSWALSAASDREWWKARCREVFAADGGGIVTVEQVLHAYGDTPDGALIDTKDVESALVTLAHEVLDEIVNEHQRAKCHIVRIPAVSWRKDLGIQPPRTDDQVAIAVEWIYGAHQLSMVVDDAREHIYDALGLAAVARLRQLGKPLAMPVDVRARIYQAWKDAKAANAARKAAKKAAEPVRLVLERMGGVAPTLPALCGYAGMQQPAVVEALLVISKARSAEAAAARAVLTAAGLRKATKADKKPQTAPAKKRRGAAAKRGWRKKGWK